MTEKGKIKVENIIKGDQYYTVTFSKVKRGRFLGSHSGFYYFANGSDMFYLLADKGFLYVYTHFEPAYREHIKRLRNEAKAVERRLNERIRKYMDNEA